MKRYAIIILVVATGLFLAVSCGKNGPFPSTPELTFKSISPPEVTQGDSSILVNIVCGFRDAEGDITGAVFFKQSNAPVGFDSIYQLPKLPEQRNMEGNIILQLHDNDLIFPVSSGADTTTFLLYIKDDAGHISDTVETSPIVLIF